MTTTIEKFVSVLQNEGVEAGRQAADAIRAEAEDEARRVLDEARQRAEGIVQEAEDQAKRTRARVETELKFAARDTVLRLSETISQIFEAVIRAAMEQELSDVEFIRTLVHDVVMQYARADSEPNGMLVINVTEDTRRQLAHWAIHALREGLKDSSVHVDVKGSLTEAGFEYRISDGTVEVTVDSLTATLSELVRPQLRDLIQSTVRDHGSSEEHGQPKT